MLWCTYIYHVYSLNENFYEPLALTQTNFTSPLYSLLGNFSPTKNLVASGVGLVSFRKIVYNMQLRVRLKKVRQTSIDKGNHTNFKHSIKS